MEHFVSIILADYELEEHLVESILDSAKVGLLESETLYETFITDNEEQVMRVELPRQLTEKESDEFAESLAHKLFEMGYANFDIEVSTEDNEQLPFDIVEDLHIFMKNDLMFYRRVYYPTLSRVATAIKQKKRVSFSSLVEPMINKALEVYCKKYDIPQSVQKRFTQSQREDLVSRIQQEETPNVQDGEY